MQTTFDVPGTITLNDVKRPAPGETAEQRTIRLARKAVIEGVRLIGDPRFGIVFATSATAANLRYRVDVAERTCTCKAEGVCKHLAYATTVLAAQPAA